MGVGGGAARACLGPSRARSAIIHFTLYVRHFQRQRSTVFMFILRSDIMPLFRTGYAYRRKVEFSLNESCMEIVQTLLDARVISIKV